MFPIISKEETGRNLHKIMLEKDISVREVQEFLYLGCPQSVYHWLDGTSMPSLDNLYALSVLFDMPIDSIVRGNRSCTYLDEHSAKEAGCSFLYSLKIYYSFTYIIFWILQKNTNI